jgi:hypothetical protein
MELPKKNSKPWKEIVELGCGGYFDPFNGDYGCEHDYGWNCDDCPCSVLPEDVESTVISIKFDMFQEE